MSAISQKTTNNDVQINITGPLIAIIIGLFMVILDGTAMNVALHGLMEEFGRNLSVVQWTISGYALAQAAVIPLSGWLSDRFGAKRLFLLSIGLFTFGSMLCVFAESIEMLITFRVLQGLGGGMVMPIAMAIIYHISPPGKVGSVMGMLGLPILMALVLGPIVGGILIEYASWEWIFLINLPVGIIGIILGIRALPILERKSMASLDIAGMLFGPLAFASLSYAVSEGGSDWTSVKTWTGLTVGICALIVIVIAELNRKQPLLDLAVFREKEFTKGIIVQWLSQFALIGTLFLIPLLLIQTRGYNTLEVGIIMLPQAIASGIFTPIGGRLFDRVGVRPLLIMGMVIVTSATFMLSQLSDEANIWIVMVPISLLGVGMGLSMMPLKTYLIQSAPQNLISRVTSLTAAAEQVMTSFAIAGLSTILASRVESRTESGFLPDISVLTISFSDTLLVVSIIAIIGVFLSLQLSKSKA